MLGQLLKNIASSHRKNGTFYAPETAEKLEISELRYRRLFETAQDGILILDGSTGKITEANSFLKDLLGYTDAELIGKQLWEIGVFKDIVDSKKAFLELQDKGYIRYKDLPLQTKDGRSIDVEFISNVFIVNTEKVIQCNIRDITNRKKAEEAVIARAKELEDLSKFQEETKKAMLNVMQDLEAAKAVIEIEKAKDEAMLVSIGDGIVELDEEGKVMIINKAACDMLGILTKEIMGKSWLEVVLMEDEKGHQVAKVKRPFTMALSHSRNTTTTTTTGPTYYYIRKDGSKFPVAITTTPVILDGNAIGAIEIFRDISHEREIDRAKSEFVSLASHQLRTPLGISKWYLEALQEEGFLNGVSPKAKDYLAEVSKSNERLLALVRGLLSVSRIDQGTVRNTPKSVNLTELVKDIIKELSIIATKNDITINLQLAKAKIPALFIDPLRVQQIIENLITNAIEYSNPGGKIEIVVEKKGDQVLISIKDHGIGISKTDQKKLFTKFFRSAKATIKNTEGSGLGLYVVKSYIEGWGGSIAVKSTEGKGSIFTMTLPLKVKKTSQNAKDFGPRAIL